MSAFPLFTPPVCYLCPHTSRLSLLRPCSAITQGHVADFTRYFSVLERHIIVCHAGLARLPRRHGTSAAPAWHVCRAGVANIQMPYTNIQKALRDGKMPRQNSCIALSTNKIARNRKKVPNLSIIFTSKNENASFFAASTVFLNLVCTIFHPIIYLSTTTHTEHGAVGVIPRVCGDRVMLLAWHARLAFRD